MWKQIPRSGNRRAKTLLASESGDGSREIEIKIKWPTATGTEKLGQEYRIRLAGSFASQSGLAKTKERKVSSKIESRRRERKREENNSGVGLGAAGLAAVAKVRSNQWKTRVGRGLDSLGPSELLSRLARSPPPACEPAPKQWQWHGR